MPGTLTLAIAAALIYWLLGPVPEGLILDRSIPWYVEPWRLWTAHLAHSDLGHLAWDLAGLLLVDQHTLACRPRGPLGGPDHWFRDAMDHCAWYSSRPTENPVTS